MSGVVDAQETTTVYLADGRVLKRERTRDFVAFSAGGWKQVGPATDWVFTLDGTPISRDEAEALIALMDENVCDGNA